MKKSLKIAILIDYLTPGGVQIAAIEEVKKLNNLGHQAVLFILTRKKSRSNLKLIKNLPHQFLEDDLPKPFQKNYKFPFFSFFSTAHLITPLFPSRLIRKKHFDLIISHGTSTCLTAMAMKKTQKIPFIAIIHDPIPYILKKSYSETPLKLLFPILFPLAHAIEAKIGKHASAILIDSPFHKKRVITSYKKNPKILPLGTKPLLKIPKKRGNRILALSRWQKEKNPKLLLHILKQLPNAQLTLAGTWTNRNDLDEFKKKAHQLNLLKRILFVENFLENQLPDLMKQARVLIHLNTEAFGMGALEAAAHGVPIIMPQRSGAASLFTHKNQGFFPEENDLENFTLYTKKLLDSENLAYKMGHSAWKKVKSNYTWHHHTQKLLELISSTPGVDS